MEIKIIAADISYASDIAKIEKEVFSHPWSEQDIKESFSFSTCFFTALVKNNTVGYAGMQITADGGYITNVAVLKEYRKNGIASALINTLKDYAKENKLLQISLEVRSGNLPAKSLYKKAGFTDVGTRKGFYRDPIEDADIMTYYF